MYSINEIKQQIEWIQCSLPDPQKNILHLLIDSRKLLFPESSLFFAFFGNQTNGHLFIDQLYQKGVRNFIIEDSSFDSSGFEHANFIIVEQSIKALQALTAWHRSRYDIPVIGITGSNGKTIIKEWIYQLLDESFNIIRSPGSYNSQIGVPLSVWQINQETQIALIEAGISKKGEMAAHGKIVSPEIGVFTNLGDAHSSGFSNKQEKLDEKLKLFIHSKVIIFDQDEEMVSSTIQNKFENNKLLSWSRTNKESDFYIESIEHINGNSKITYLWKDQTNSYVIPFKDPVSIRLSIFTVLTCLALGIEERTFLPLTASLSALNMRLEVKDGYNNCLLINDSYNADLSSFTQALQFLSLQDDNRSKSLILSDFQQLGLSRKEINQKIATLLDKYRLTKLILVGEDLAEVGQLLKQKPELHHFKTTGQLLRQLGNIDFENECILLKGARKFKFEKIFDKLSSSYHSTVLEINLDSIVKNIQVYRSKLSPETRVMAVIKASGYGAGSVKLARHMEKNAINYFAVAFVDEGIELRKGGVRNPIMVFNADVGLMAEIIRHGLEPVVYSFDYLEKISKLAPEGLGIHLKIDSGLNRLGFQQKDWEQLCHEIDKVKHLRILSIFSHFSASPNTKYDDFSIHQAKVFERAYQKVSQRLTYKPLKHLLNSAGVIKFNEYQFDMVRIGSGLHGIDTSDHIMSGLHTVHTLKARINMVKEVKAGDSIGYERMGISDKVRKIAIIPIGYADGLVRKAGNNRFSVYLNGCYAPIVGNVAMDMTMIDISKVPNVEAGDEVEIFGPNASIRDLAKAGDTIFYEILTRISPRVKRIYTYS